MTTTPFATRSLLPNYGIPAAALGNVTTTQQDACMVSATDEMYTYLAGRWPIPFVSWDDSITAKCCEIAAYKIVCIRGFNPAAGADMVLRQRYEDAIEWCKGVERKAVHPTVVSASSPIPNYNQPKVLSFSVANTGGGTASNRGW